MRNLFHIFRSQSGVALPVSLSVLLVMFLLTGVAATASIGATHQSQRDLHAKRAVAAAQAGIAAAVHRLNTVGLEPGWCVVEEAGGLTTRLPDDPPAGDGWCPIQPEDLGDGESFVARTDSGSSTDNRCQSLHTRKVVSSGFSGNVARRVIATVSANTGMVFSQCGIIAWKKFFMKGHPYVRGDVVTNGDAALNTNSRICGDVFAERWFQRDVSIQECGDVTEFGEPGPYKLRNVQQPDCLKTPRSQGGCNDNERITLNGAPGDPGPDGTGVDPLIPHNGNEANVIWNDGPYGGGNDTDKPERQLMLKKKSTLTLTGNVYSFCELVMRGGGTSSNPYTSYGAKLIIAPRIPDSVVKIFFDSPENCPDVNPAVTSNLYLNVYEKARIINTNPDPTTLQIYMVGTFDPGRKYGTKIRLKGQTWDRYTSMVLYAPRSKVALQGRFRLLGSVAAKQVSMWETARVLWSDDVTKLNGSNFSVLPSFVTDSWAECAPPPLQSGPGAFIEGCTD